MSEPRSENVPLTRTLLERLLGLYPEDWHIERWAEPYEGWQASLVRTCDVKGCMCCDPLNLSAEDADAIEAVLSGSYEHPSEPAQGGQAAVPCVDHPSLEKGTHK